MTTLEERLQRLEDRDAIHQLFIDYGRHLDQGNWDAYAQLFAEDGEVLLGPMGRASGRANIQELMTKTLSPGLGSSYHLITSPDVRIDGDTAMAEVMWTVITRGEDGKPFLGMVGKHMDTIVRTPEGWRIKRRAGDVSLPSKMQR